MAAVRRGSAVWEGKLRDGKGTLTLGDQVYTGAYSFGSRFENGPGTNPEELIAAAHAACFSMALAGGLGGAGYSPKRVATKARVTVGKVGDGFKITLIELDSEAEVPGIEAKTFQEIAEKTKTGCPVSQALAAVEIKLNAKLL